jgi:hypothetical protein
MSERNKNNIKSCVGVKRESDESKIIKSGALIALIVAYPVQLCTG